MYEEKIKEKEAAPVPEAAKDDTAKDDTAKPVSNLIKAGNILADVNDRVEAEILATIESKEKLLASADALAEVVKSFRIQIEATMDLHILKMRRFLED